jgi:hypothetical protein
MVGVSAPEQSVPIYSTKAGSFIVGDDGAHMAGDSAAVFEA